MERVKGWDEQRCFRKKQEHVGDGGRREQCSMAGHQTWVLERMEAGGISRCHIWQILGASLVKGQWGTTKEEREYDLCFRKDTMAAVGRMVGKRVRLEVWRPARKLL